MKSFSRRLGAALALVLVAGLTGPASAGVLKRGDPIPPIDAVTIDGQATDRALFKRAPMGVLYFFSTRCTACVQDLVQIAQFKADHGAKVDVMAVGRQPASDLTDYLRAAGVTLPVIAGSDTL